MRAPLPRIAVLTAMVGAGRTRVALVRVVIGATLAITPAFAQDVSPSGVPGTGDVFSSGGGTPGPGVGPPAPGGGPMYGGGRYGRDPECGGTDRSYYNQMYNSRAIVLPPQVSQDIYRRTGGQAWYRCGACGNKVICWPRPGFDTMIRDALNGTPPPPQQAMREPPPAYNPTTNRFELGAEDNEPAATSLEQANAVAGDIIQGLRLLYGDQTIDELAVPRSHQQNIESAVTDYLNKVALGGIVARLTKGQVKAFIGRVGETIMAKVFPKAARQVPVPGFPGRIADQLEGRTVREIKTGGFGLRGILPRQIGIDAQMVKAGYRVEWWNVRSPFGRQSFSPELIDELIRNGIVPVSHINP